VFGVGRDAVGAAMVSVVVRARASGAAVAALPRPRCQRRCPLAAAEVTAGAGMLHVIVRTWFPAAWMNTTRAFKPQAVHLSYSAIKSAEEMAGCCLVQMGSTARAPTLPLAMLAHVGSLARQRGGGMTVPGKR
jgi:hypothetical protein